MTTTREISFDKPQLIQYRGWTSPQDSGDACSAYCAWHQSVWQLVFLTARAFSEASIGTPYISDNQNMNMVRWLDAMYSRAGLKETAAVYPMMYLLPSLKCQT